MKLKALSMLIFSILLSGCFSKNEPDYNKPAIFWYEKIINSVANSNLDVADEHFTSLYSEHPNSALLKEAMIILALAHISNEEYVLANFYLDEFIKKFGDRDSIEFARFLKVKANFLAFKSRFRNQELLEESIKLAKEFKENYPYSIYTQLIDTMIAKLSLSIDNLNEEIATLYYKLDENEGEKLYKDKLINTEFKDLKHKKASVVWYKAIFE